ncbi:uncharacterized protein FFB20_12179 [Fusarium fujikuroi]|uniref:Uncharacterized protein n=1 Tax=Fusarium fujikuroi TaxID=5127 RepID=A0A2H3RBN8_FUSFU|nr:uncharacterized protein FFE2_00165 [Fusarium fujikuroi]SCN68848.1 uncharacterized protein FFC1_00162 [Fusarium fujikuroi]SCN71356.1 uncharacterized protein FFM5_00130 [Fusarium fujikuroi]SCO04723.1 uncharacterized protein FFB20_12179 [Fusarium fujikuroi]SCO28155.1 uncharacterized protein FFNC_00163 [Fusarium fujikuroi]
MSSRSVEFQPSLLKHFPSRLNTISSDNHHLRMKAWTEVQFVANVNPSYNHAQKPSFDYFTA